jgi:hypothetical protein
MGLLDLFMGVMGGNPPLRYGESRQTTEPPQSCLINAAMMGREVSRLMGYPCKVEWTLGDTWRANVDGGWFEFVATDEDRAMPLDEFVRRFLLAPTMLAKMQERRVAGNLPLA